MTILDNLSQIKKLDKFKMAKFIAEFPEKCQEVYQEAGKINLPKNYQESKNVIICGMGASGISGELIKNLVEQLKKPLVVNHYWDLPDSANKNSLVILISYSGNTLETFSCAQMAIKKGCKIFIISGGGKLKTLAGEKPSFIFHYSAPPRASLAYFLMPLLVVFEKIKLIDKNQGLNSLLNKLKKISRGWLPKTLTEKNFAKYLAYSIFDRLPVIIAPPELSGVAQRWKTQLAENGKSFSFFETKPEIFHNFIESQFPWRLSDELFFLIFENVEKTSLAEKSSKIFENILKRKNICWAKVPNFGKNLWQQTFSLILLGDWLSFYLAILYQVDPTPVGQIERFKKYFKK